MILLDTHALVWLASDPDRLSPTARQLIETHASSLHCSVVSAWEIALLVRRGRLQLPMPPDQFLERAINHHALLEIDISRPAATVSVALPPIHNDPFDRLLIAECLIRKMPLISCDQTIPRYPGIQVFW